MKKCISLFAMFVLMAMVAGSAYAGGVKTETDWEKGTFTAYLPTDLKNLEPYSHIWNFNPTDKTRTTYEQNFAENVISYSQNAGFLVVTVVIPNFTGDKIVRIWADNGEKSLYCNPNAYHAYPALNTATDIKHYDYEFLVKTADRVVTKVPRGTPMDKFVSN